MGVKEDIELLDVKLGRLRLEYDQYFLRLLKREPLNLRADVERLIARNSNIPITSTVLKFKLASLVAKYVSYKQYWTRTLREMEDGTFERRAEAGGAIPNPSPEPSVSEKSPPEVVDNGGILKTVYAQYIEARKKCNESTNGISYETFKNSIEDQKRKLLEGSGIKEVDVSVSIKNGKTKLSLVAKKSNV